MKGQKILSVNWSRRGAEERRGAVIKKVSGHIDFTNNSVYTVCLFHNKQSRMAQSSPWLFVDSLLRLAFVGWHMTFWGKKWWESNLVVKLSGEQQFSLFSPGLVFFLQSMAEEGRQDKGLALTDYWVKNDFISNKSCSALLLQHFGRLACLPSYHKLDGRVDINFMLH